jgi:hypothetical protein
MRLAMPDMDLVSFGERWRMRSRPASLRRQPFCGGRRRR